MNQLVIEAIERAIRADISLDQSRIVYILQEFWATIDDEYTTRSALMRLAPALDVNSGVCQFCNCVTQGVDQRD